MAIFQINLRLFKYKFLWKCIFWKSRQIITFVYSFLTLIDELVSRGYLLFDSMVKLVVVCLAAHETHYFLMIVDKLGLILSLSPRLVFLFSYFSFNICHLPPPPIHILSSTPPPFPAKRGGKINWPKFLFFLLQRTRPWLSGEGKVREKGEHKAKVHHKGQACWRSKIIYRTMGLAICFPNFVDALLIEEDCICNVPKIWTEPCVCVRMRARARVRVCKCVCARMTVRTLTCWPDVDSLAMCGLVDCLLTCSPHNGSLTTERLGDHMLTVCWHIENIIVYWCSRCDNLHWSCLYGFFINPDMT